MATTKASEFLNSGAAGGAKLWVSGDTIAQWALVTSPLDGEVYRRKTATGAGTTDPANDLTNYTAVSFQRATAITNAWSAGAAATSITATPAVNNMVAVSPALSATVRTSILSVTGKGNLLGVHLHRYQGGGGGTAMNVRTEIILDGRPVFDATNAFAGGTTNYSYVTAAGVVYYDTNASNRGIVLPGGFDFARTLEIFVTASIAPVAPQQLFIQYAYSLRG